MASKRRALYAAAVNSRPPRGGGAGQAAGRMVGYQQGRAQSERERAQAYYRHKLGYDKPGVSLRGVKRAARKAGRKINPFD